MTEFERKVAKARRSANRTEMNWLISHEGSIYRVYPKSSDPRVPVWEAAFKDGKPTPVIVPRT